MTLTKRSYHPYEHYTLVNDWAALIAEDRDTIVALEASWNAKLEANRKIREELKHDVEKELHEVAELLEARGVQVYKRNRKGEVNTSEYYAWFDKNVANSIRAQFGYYTAAQFMLDRQELPQPYQTTQTVGDFELKIRNRSMSLVEMYDSLVAQHARLQDEANQKNKLYQASLAYAAEHGLDITDMSVFQVIQTVEKHAQEAYKAEHLPADTPMDFYECDDCDLYFMGDRRCSCGNRRVAIDFDGNILEGFTPIAQAW